MVYLGPRVRLVAAVQHGLIYTDLGEDRSAMAIDPTGKGDVTKTHVKWKVPEIDGQWSSAVSDGEYVYRLDEASELTCRSLFTGKKVYAHTLENVSALASPVATADGRIYFVGSAKGYVVKAGPKFEVIGGGHLGGYDFVLGRRWRFRPAVFTSATASRCTASARNRAVAIQKGLS